MLLSFQRKHGSLSGDPRFLFGAKDSMNYTIKLTGKKQGVLMKHHSIRRDVSILLSALLLSGVLSFAVPAAEADTVEQIHHTFNGLGNENDFTDSHNFGISFVKGRMQTYNNAVRVNTCDLRWWSVNYYDDYMHFEYSLSFDENYADTILYFNIHNHTPSTTTESPDGGLVTKVISDGGDPCLTDRNGNRLMYFTTDGTVYRIRVSMTYGSDKYAVYCDDTLLSDQCTFVSPVYGIFGMRFHGASDTEESYLTLDELYFYTEGRSYAQKFSYQAPGEIPSVTIPDAPADDGYTFWYNGERYDCPADIVLTDGTVYLPLEWVGKVLGSPEQEAEIDTAGSVLTTSLASVTMNHPFREDNGDLTVPAQYIAERYEAKVWLDTTHEMLIVTTGEHRNDNILRKYGHVLVQNGEPFYEISFNKFDLNWQIAADPSFHNGAAASRDFASSDACLGAAEEALKQLSENGFRTIRVFCNNIHMGKSQAERNRFFTIADTMYDLCDRYGIQVVACLGLLSEEFLPGSYVDGIGWVRGGESFYDLLTDENSQSRANLYDFIDAYVTRYKDRDTILMWEIVNEGNLGADIGYQVKSIAYSLGQLGSFYKDIAARIRRNDPSRLVTGGDSILRSAQWNLYEGTMRGQQSPDWTTDTWEERLKALLVLHEGLDVISFHGYDVGYSETYIDADNKSRYTTWELFLGEAERLGLALYNGETRGALGENGKPVSLPNIGTESAAARGRFLNTIVDAGVQLSHWWAFHSDRATFGNDVDSWSVRVDDDTAATFIAIRDANEALQNRYKVNPLAAENTAVLGDARTAAHAAEAESSGDTQSDAQPEEGNDSAAVETQSESHSKEELSHTVGNTPSDVQSEKRNSFAVPIAIVVLAVPVGAVCAVIVLRKKKK